MPELLVLFACANHTGCSETSSQYYIQHPEFREFVETQGNRIKEAVPAIVTEYMAPVLWAAAGQEATTRISTRFYLTFKLDRQVLMFKQEF